jgi:hypothetical protein
MQAIADELAAGRAQLLRETAGLSQAQTDWCPAPGHWSIGEVLDHITVAEAVWGRTISNVLKVAEARGALPPYPHATVAFRWRPPTADERWEVPAPEAAVPVPGKPIVALREALQDQAGWTARVLGRIAATDPRQFTVIHPILGAMNLAEAYLFAAWHMRVHLKQLLDIKQATGFPGSDPNYPHRAGTRVHDRSSQ